MAAVDNAGWNSNSPISAVIEVVGVNNLPPVLAIIGNKKASVGINLAFTVSAIDPDGDPKWYHATGLPAVATFDTSTRVFSWTPTLSQVGNYSVTFRVTDGLSSDSETITIAVGVNQPPVLAPIGNKIVNGGVNLTFTVSATDPNGNMLTYSATNLPSGSGFNGQTFSWTPDYSQAGAYGITFTASDGALVDSETITITVADTLDLSLSNRTINSGVAQYRAQNSITAGPAFVVGGTADVTFKAGAVITLKPGFRAMAGSKFRAVPNLN